MHFLKKKKFLIPIIIILILSIFDLLLVQSTSFRSKVQEALWQPSDEILNLLAALEMEPYTVLSKESTEGTNTFLELESLYFWVNFSGSEDFIVKHSLEEKTLYFASSKGILGKPYINILKHLDLPINSGCIGGLDVSYIKFDGEAEKLLFLVINKQSYFLDVSDEIASKLSEKAC